MSLPCHRDQPACGKPVQCAAESLRNGTEPGGQFVLGESQPAPRGCALLAAKLKEVAGRTSRDGQQQFLHTLVQHHEPPSHGGNDHEGKFRLRQHEIAKRTRLEAAEPARRQGLSAGRIGIVEEDRFAERVSRGDEPVGGLAPIEQGLGNFHRARSQQVERLSLVTWENTQAWAGMVTALAMPESLSSCSSDIPANKGARLRSSMVTPPTLPLTAPDQPLAHVCKRYRGERRDHRFLGRQVGLDRVGHDLGQEVRRDPPSPRRSHAR